MKHVGLLNANSVDAIKGVSIIIIAFYHIACIAKDLVLLVESMALPAFMFSSAYKMLHTICFSLCVGTWCYG